MLRPRKSLVTTVRFKRFTRRGYALFSTLNKVVLIAVLTVSTLTHSKAKEHNEYSVAAHDTVAVATTTLDEVEIVGVLAAEGTPPAALGVFAEPSAAGSKPSAAGKEGTLNPAGNASAAGSKASAAGKEGPLNPARTGTGTCVAARRDTVVAAGEMLDEVEVVGVLAAEGGATVGQQVVVIPREEIALSAAASSLPDFLKTLSFVDVRQRGAFGTQVDLTLRGGGSDDISLAINGVNISCPQTGHLSALFPLANDDIDHIEVLDGGGALDGSINIVTRKSGPPVMATLSAGTYGYINTSGNLLLPAGPTTTFLSAGYTHCDGATSHSASTTSRLFVLETLHLRHLTLSAQGAFQYRPYDANTFYGAASADQWEAVETCQTALTAQWQVSRRVVLTPQVVWNRWYDHYQWHKGDPSGENLHRTDQYIVSLLATVQSIAGTSSAAVSYRRETILSTSLGLPLSEDKYRPTGGISRNKDRQYTYHDGRSLPEIALRHTFSWRQLVVSAAVDLQHTPFKHWTADPSLFLTYGVGTPFSATIAYTMSRRLPTFTDLYYSGTNIEGNSRLRAESGSALTLSLRYHLRRGVQMTAAAFVARKRDMIDWVQYAAQDDDIFHSTNFRQHSVGATLSLAGDIRALLSPAAPLTKVDVAYTYLHAASTYLAEIRASKYAMEYLRHKVTVTTQWSLLPRLTCTVAARYHYRVSAERHNYNIVDVHLQYALATATLFLDGNNILNKQYYDYISIPQPRLTVMGGVRLHL